jgi:hypothetical protein
MTDAVWAPLYWKVLWERGSAMLSCNFQGTIGKHFEFVNGGTIVSPTANCRILPTRNSPMSPSIANQSHTNSNGY